MEQCTKARQAGQQGEQADLVRTPGVPEEVGVCHSQGTEDSTRFHFRAYWILFRVFGPHTISCCVVHGVVHGCGRTH